MIRLNVHEIKNQLSKYLEMVEAGTTVVICRRNVPVAEIRPIAKKEKRVPRIGWADGRPSALASLLETLPEEEAQLWEGDEADPLRKYLPKPKRGRK